MEENSPEVDLHFGGTLAYDGDGITVGEKRMDYLVNKTI